MQKPVYYFQIQGSKSVWIYTMEFTYEVTSPSLSGASLYRACHSSQVDTYLWDTAFELKGWFASEKSQGNLHTHAHKKISLIENK